MPTPYGSRGGMAFGAGELRVLRRALALALHPSSATVQDVQDCYRLAESVDDAARESARFRAFLLADLARYRTALPGTASGYFALLSDVLDTGYRPETADFAALRALRGNPVAAALLDRCRAVVAETVQARPADRAPLPAARAERAPGAPSPRSGGTSSGVHAGTRSTALGAPSGPRATPPAPVPHEPVPQEPAPRGATPPHGAPLPRPVATVPPPALAVFPVSRRRLLALPGGLAADAPYAAEAAGAPEPSGPAEPREEPSRAPETGPESEQEEGAPDRQTAPEPERAPESEPAPEPAKPESEPKRRAPARPAAPGRPVPTPAEVFPPKRRSAPPGKSSSTVAGRCPRQLAAG
ncbi:hypothetical protein [Streptomyces odontomachi]|uniref:hypothetical protein n=1 Tax=Streptomyces odontomachi TaxID=2944940 RepID=UPI0035A97123